MRLLLSLLLLALTISLGVRVSKMEPPLKPSKLCQRVCESYVDPSVNRTGYENREGACFCLITPDL